MKIFHPIVTYLTHEARNIWMDEGGNLITENQARILAHALHEIRPAWGIDATLKVLERNHDHPSPFADIIAAAVMAARDTETQTPGRIFQVSIHWPEDAKRKLPRVPDCPDHIGQDMYTCRSCKADVLCGDRPPDMVGKHYDPPPAQPEAPANAGASTISQEET